MADKSKRKSIKWILILVAAILVICFTGAEMYARFVLGLGTPVLSVADATIDYYFKPGQDLRRFGNHVVYNNRSMRTNYDIEEGPRNCKRRVVVCGDSIVNGGTLTDQEDVATTIVQGHYSTNDLQILNVSAGSWGPANLVKYFEKFGIFDATDLIVEVSSHDLWEDDPSLSKGACVGNDVSFPGERPLFAVQELIARYVMPRIRARLGLAQVNTKVDVARWGEESDVAAQKFNLGMMQGCYLVAE